MFLISVLNNYKIQFVCTYIVNMSIYNLNIFFFNYLPSYIICLLFVYTIKKLRLLVFINKHNNLSFIQQFEIPMIRKWFKLL